MPQSLSPSNDSNEPRIDELVGFLFATAPDSVSRLNSEFPEFSDELRPGRNCGPVGTALARIRFLRKTAIFSLAAAINKAEADVSLIVVTLQRVRTLETVSELITIGGSSLTAVLLAVGLKNQEPLISSILTLCGGIASTLAKRKLLGTTGRGSLIEAYGDGLSLIADMTAIKTNLESYVVSNALDDGDSVEIMKLVNRANECVKLVYTRLRDAR